jgi:hypothetical protein
MINLFSFFDPATGTSELCRKLGENGRRVTVIGNRNWTGSVTIQHGAWSADGLHTAVNITSQGNERKGNSFFFDLLFESAVPTSEQPPGSNGSCGR